MVQHCRLACFLALLTVGLAVPGCSGVGTPPDAYRGSPDPHRQDYAPPYIWGPPGQGCVC
jgi:hypothetical protein